MPVNLYESLIEIMEGEPKILYTHVDYSLATEEAERIGVDHIAKSSVTGTSHTSAGECTGHAGVFSGHAACSVSWVYMHVCTCMCTTN